MFCPKCGSENFDTNKFCKKCGKQLPNRAQGGQGVSQSFSLSHPSNLLGQVLDGKYRIEAKLGSGGMGDVYRATRLLIGDQVAIKVLHPHLAIDPQAAERFRREAVTATQLRHRNVVGIYDVGISAVHNVPYILMELAEGYSLRQMINEHKVLPLDFVVTVTAQVCSALDEAHKLGIVHRDIKPENIIAHQTTAGWQVKILDFGIAKLYNQADIGLTQDGTAMGTPQYMSPEQCLGEPVDARSDVYSTGIVIYEMLCGTVPFKSAAASAVAVFQVQNQPTAPRLLNPEIHPEVEAVILRSLEKDPNVRPSSATRFSQDFIKAATAAFKSGQSKISASPVSAPETTPEFNIAVSEDGIGIEPRIGFELNERNDAVCDGSFEGSGAAEHAVLENASVVDVENGGSLITFADVISGQNFADEQSIISEVVNQDTGRLDSPILPPADELVGFDDSSLKSNKQYPIRRTEVVDDSESVASSVVWPPAQNPVDEQSCGSNSPPEEVDDAQTNSQTKGRVIGRLLAVIMLLSAGIVVTAWYVSKNAGNNEPANAAPSKRSSELPQPPSGMAFIPGGEFMMGSNEGDEYSRPAHMVRVQPFFMDIYEVTNEEFKKFVDATGHKAPSEWRNGSFREGLGRHPVTGVDWEDSEAFAKWAGKRLPTEAEWEFAARGDDGRLYPWGNEWRSECANADKQEFRVQEVGKANCPSPFGMFDMVGNAWEWTSDDAKAYPTGKQFGGHRVSPKIIRGSYWGSSKEQSTTIFRRAYGAVSENDYRNSGFRCVADLK